MQRCGLAGSAGLVAVAVLLAAAAHAAGHVRRVLLGRSVDGRAIVVYEIGDTDSRRRELVVGCIHGNERAGVAIARKLEQASPLGIDLWIVPVLNPDGLLARTRGNAHSVDLNRNFPWRWRPLRGLFYSGPHPLSGSGGEPVQDRGGEVLAARLVAPIPNFFKSPNYQITQSPNDLGGTGFEPVAAGV